MTSFNLQTLGTVEVGKKLIAKINISAEELFNKFPELTARLSFDCKNMIRLAINNDLEPQLRGNKDETVAFFCALETHLQQLGFGLDEKEELENAEKLKGEDIDEVESVTQNNLETYDEKSGKLEGKIKLGDNQMESKLVPIKFEEKIELFYEHDSSPLDKEIIRTGRMEIINESEKDRLWDIDLKLASISQTNIENESIILQELNPKAIHDFEYTFEADVEPEISVQEFISTVGDPDIESYSLAVNAENEIYMRLILSNDGTNDITKIATYKIIPDEFSNVQILNQSHGEAEIKEKDGKKVIFWYIEKLPQGAKAKIDLRVQVYVPNKDIKLRSGKFAIKYLIPKMLSELEIKSFDAYTNNSFNIITTELDEEPNTYECKFIFENKSEFQIRLVNADVYNPNNSNEKFVDIDPNEIPLIPGGGSWESEVWTYQTEEGEYPEFKTQVEFFAIADHQLTSKIKLNFADVELAVAALEGAVGYDIEKLPSFKITPFNLGAKVTNTGGADLNEVKLVENIQAEFLPPKPYEVEILFNGSIIEKPDNAVTIEPNDQDPTKEHIITIQLENLKDSDYGPLKPGDEIEFKYPITAFKPTRETLYQANAILSANTYPRGKPIEIKAEPIEIEVVHLRKNLAKGKNIQALESEGEYEITLSIKNLGEAEITNYKLKETIPIGLELFDVIPEANISEKDDSKILTWKFDTIGIGEIIEVIYKIKPTSEAKISETQKDD
ncbi:MAG: hypothetical protein JXA54_12435 [Candidatus Heimdallarchaeota archaeon]|nr:hypothetical protein [Candidatus Heimdallarchaeota archaeon]